MKIWKFPDQVVRLSVVFAVAIAGLVTFRILFVPASFGDLGHFRADSIPENMGLPMQYAGAQVCPDCHEDIADQKAKSYHRTLSCEGCHGPALAHTEDYEKVKPMIPSKREQCTICHGYLISRPTGFPQINAEAHNPNKPCPTCHNPHDPTPPRVPGDCSACHANIARMKSLSYHATLECTTCHAAKPEHRENPRANLPGKPLERAFCGQCHAKGADSPKEIPRVDLATHGGRYLCWQCHYPHFPEAR